MEKPEQYIERRSSERTIAMLECHCCNTEYFGTVVNISENGMFIRSQKIILPLKSHFDIFIPLKEDVLSVSVKVNRLTKSNGYYDGIGIELSNPPKEYLDLVGNLKSF